MCANDFKPGENWGCDEFVRCEEVFNIRRKDYLPGDVLTARCRIWDLDENIARDGHWFARSRIGVQRRSFLWNIEKFSSFQESICEIDSSFGDRCMIILKFFPSEGQNSETIIRVEVCTNDERFSFLSFSLTYCRLFRILHKMSQ
ncbi:hypothetical protein TNIN_125961 [Trichonephila inaurata madagascariensis]|uniref:MATH domain-containing protein n=1 Tax=Trichonephila inaurata madagascariensis TaxID=2747483 RepID=A0A8X7CAM0_9ARAC|nr:hypothetical protein TNIN_125961 [Trichonephila inaurata madagascariensis]